MIGTRQKTEGLNSERLLKILRLSLGQIRPGGWQECSRIQTLDPRPVMELSLVVKIISVCPRKDDICIWCGHKSDLTGQSVDRHKQENNRTVRVTGQDLLS